MKTTKGFLKDYILEYIEENKIANFNELDREALISYLYDRIDETEVIYYEKAISFLNEYDPSFLISLEIAKELGFSIADLNSEVLATLLLQETLREELQNIEDYLAEIFGK